MSALGRQTDLEYHVSARQALDLSAAAYCREHTSSVFTGGANYPDRGHPLEKHRVRGWG